MAEVWPELEIVAEARDGAEAVAQADAVRPEVVFLEIDVSEVLFFRSDEKYTRVQTRSQEAFVRTPIRELVPQLDPQQFWQIHRSPVVNLGAIAAVTRDDSGRQRVRIDGHPEVLEVSRSYAHLFRGA